MSSSNNLQVWDNAAFDDSLGFGPVPAHLPLQPISLNLFLDAGADDDHLLKENRGPIQQPQTNKKKPIYNIDAEIADIETEIGRLSKKLESLKLKKQAQQHASPAAAVPAARRGRIVPAKFLSSLETPPPPSSKKAQDSGGSRRRGLSLGPAEISKAQKHIFQKKLEGIKEEEKDLGRRRGMSLGPSEILRQRPPMINSRVSELRKGIETVGSKKPTARMDNGVIDIKPKTLFEEKKRPLKARIVASRYCNEDIGRKRRKWSLPEEAEKEIGAKSKKRSFSLGGGARNAATIATATATPSSIRKIGEGLPKIRTARVGVVESPRDSGCAKRVAELVGRRPCFFSEDGAGDHCKSLLSFDDGDVALSS